VIPDGAFCPLWKAIAANTVRPPTLKATEGFAAPSDVSLPEVTRIVLSAAVVTVIATASFVDPAPVTVTATVCGPVGTLASR